MQIEPAELDFLADQMAAGIPAIAADRGKSTGPAPMPIWWNCAQHIANRDAYNRDGGRLEFEADPLWLAYERTATLSIMPARNHAGLGPSGRAAKAQARRLDGTEEPEGTVAAAWAFDLANDLLRLHGEMAP